MAGRVDDATHAAAIAKIGDAVKFADELLVHLKELINGPAFKGSHRSQEFLKYIVERALRGEFDDLRERQIGINLFGRSASYDTAEDAIVRVTASDVRKRLLQHYGLADRSSYRIDLPSGSYIPEFRCQAPAPVDGAESQALPGESLAPPVPGEKASPTAVTSRSRPALAAALTFGILALAAAAWLVIGHPFRFTSAPADNLVSATFLSNPGVLDVIVSVEALVLVQVLSGRRATLTQYQDLSYLSVPELVEQKGLQNFWASLSKRQITNVGDLQNAMRIAESLRARSWTVNIRHAHLRCRH